LKLAAIRYRAQKRLVPSAPELLAADPRPPVVYLRAFADDGKQDPMSASVPYGSDAISGAIVAVLSERLDLHLMRRLRRRNV
jgi:hypothetical protein